MVTKLIDPIKSPTIEQDRTQTCLDLSPLDIRELFEENTRPQVAESRALCEGNLNEVASLNGDLLGVIRKTNGIYSAVMNPPDVANGLNGFTLGLGAVQSVTGMLSCQRGYVTMQASSNNGDQIGLGTGALRIAQGAGASLSGAGSAAVAGASLAGKTNNILQGIGWLSTITGGCVGVIGIMRQACSLMENFAVSRPLFKVLKNQRDKDFALKALKGMLSVVNEDRKKILDQLFDGKKPSWKVKITAPLRRILLRQDLVKEKKTFILQQNLQKILTHPNCLDELTKNLQETSPLASQDKRFMQYYIHNHPVLKTLDLQAKEKCILLLSSVYQSALGDVKSKKEAIFKRVVGTEAYHLMQSLLVGKASKISDSDKDTLLDVCKKGIFINRIISIGMLALSSMGITVMMVAQLGTGGSCALIGLIISLALSLGWSIIDGYALYQAFQNNVATIKDKIFMVLAVASTLATAVVGVVLTETVSQLAPLIGAAAICAILMLYLIDIWKPSSESNLLQVKKTHKLTEPINDSIVS